MEFVYLNGTVYKIDNVVSFQENSGKPLVTDKEGTVHIVQPGFIVMRMLLNPQEDAPQENKDKPKKKDQDNNKAD